MMDKLPIPERELSKDKEVANCIGFRIDKYNYPERYASTSMCPIFDYYAHYPDTWDTATKLMQEYYKTKRIMWPR